MVIPDSKPGKRKNNAENRRRGNGFGLTASFCFIWLKNEEIYGTLRKKKHMRRAEGGAFL